jgi:hypothetical protein
METIIAPQETKYAPFVQILEDGSEFHCELPIDSQFNDGTGSNYYMRKGFIPLGVFLAEKHKKEVAAEREKLTVKPPKQKKGKNGQT